MKIRKISGKDIKRCSEILKDCYEMEPYNEKFQGENALLYINSKLKNSKDSSFLIEDDKRFVVGFVIASMSYWSNGKQAIMEEICVDPKYHKMGYGTKLFDYIHDFLKQKGVVSSTLWVNKNAPAFKLYQKKGYSASKDSKVMFYNLK